MGTTVFVLFGMMVLLMGCQPAKIDVKNENQNLKTENWEITVSKSVFFSLNVDVMNACTAVNERVNHLLDSLQNAIKVEADTFFTTYAKNQEERPTFSYQLFSTDTVFRATDRYISLRITVYSYSGGAHGITNFYMFNYDVKRQKFLSVCDIVACEKSPEINLLLEKHFDNKDQCFADRPTIQTQGFAGINIAESGICFTYEHYALGPYACGYVQITVPTDEIFGVLKINRKFN